MNNREAIEKRLMKVLKAEVAHCFSDCLGACVSCNNGNCECDNALKLNMLMELEQYRLLGTYEQLREAVERMKPKKPIINNPKISKFYVKEAHLCPNCYEYINSSSGNCCSNCGQKLDWSMEK